MGCRAQLTPISWARHAVAVSWWFSPEYRDRMHTVAEIDSIRYGFELLRSGVVRASMLVAEGIMQAVEQGALRDGTGLRTLRLEEDMGPRQRVLVGAFTRAGERGRRRHDKDRCRHRPSHRVRRDRTPALTYLPWLRRLAYWPLMA